MTSKINGGGWSQVLPKKNESNAIGGYARAEALTAEERKAIAVLAANKRWGNTITVTNEAVFNAAAFIDRLKCERLDTLKQIRALRSTLRMLNHNIHEIQRRLEPKTRMETVGQLPTLYAQDDCYPL